MLHIDLPSRADTQSLLEARHPSSVSLYLPTTPVSAEVGRGFDELTRLLGLPHLSAVTSARRSTVWTSVVGRVVQALEGPLGGQPG